MLCDFLMYQEEDRLAFISTHNSFKILKKGTPHKEGWLKMTPDPAISKK